MSESSGDIFGGGTRPAGREVVLTGRYRIIRELGRDAMGTVYLAADRTMDGVRVAVKMPPRVIASGDRSLAALKAEGPAPPAGSSGSHSPPATRSSPSGS